MMVATSLVAICAILLLQGFFSGSEIAMVSANQLTLQTRADEGNSGARLALSMLDKEALLLGTCLIGTNLCLVSGTVLATALTTEALAAWQSDAALSTTHLGIVAASYIVAAPVLGEALPKTVYAHYATMLASVIAWPLRGVQLILTPLLWGVRAWSVLLTRVTGAPEERAIMRHEIIDLLEDQLATTDIDQDEHRMIQGVLSIADVMVEECMTPLIDLTGMSVAASLEDAASICLSSGHSRLPVYRERIDNIVGVLHARDLLFAGPNSELEPLMRPVSFVPESKPIDELLQEMQRRREHFAVVVDEYGGATGIITIEDLVEEIIGEIRDERDRKEPGLRQITEKTWRVPGRVEVEVLEDTVGHEFTEGDYETVAGLILHEASRIPVVGEEFVIDGATFRIHEASDRAILVAHLVLP